MVTSRQRDIPTRSALHSTLGQTRFTVLIHLPGPQPYYKRELVFREINYRPATSEMGAQPGSSESLSIIDNRTGKTYTVPITDNSVSASAFKAISAPFKKGERVENDTDKGLRVADKGIGSV